MTTQQWNPEIYEKPRASFPISGRASSSCSRRKPASGFSISAAVTARLTEKLVAAGCGVVASAEQVAGAVTRDLDARVARAEALPFEHEFAAVFSNAVLHWVKDADGVIASVARAGRRARQRLRRHDQLRHLPRRGLQAGAGAPRAA